MASNNAKAVAKEVIRTIGKHRKVKLGEIIRKQGYSAKTSKTPQLVTKTKSYQDEITPVVEAMIVERDRAIRAMRGKISKAKYRDVVDAADKLTKNIQLLQGKDTDKHGFNIGAIIDSLGE